MLRLGSLGRFARNIGLIVLAVSAGFVLVELLVGHVLSFPRRPRAHLAVINERSGPYDQLAWEQPNARFWNVEGGNIVVQYNNLGFPGCDVEAAPDARYVFVLGSSFVEGLQLDRDSIATSVLQRILSTRHPQYQVLNLGSSGSDAYTSWFRARYFERRFPPSGVILVAESFHGDWLENHIHPLGFALAPSFGSEVVPAFPMSTVRWLREKSAFVNLVAEALRSAGRREGGGALQEAGSTGHDTMPGDFASCLESYRQEYGRRFAVVSLVAEKDWGKSLAEYCRRLGIAFVNASMAGSPDKRFQGWGHLNASGNSALGRALYEAFLMIVDHATALAPDPVGAGARRAPTSTLGG